MALGIAGYALTIVDTSLELGGLTKIRGYPPEISELDAKHWQYFLCTPSNACIGHGVAGKISARRVALGRVAGAMAE